LPKQLILIWGSNSIGSNLHFWRYAQEAKRNGAKLVCIDPRKRDRRQMPRAHRPAPGTDAALALALMHELIVHDWLDHDYIARTPWAGSAARTRPAMAARARGRGLRHAGGTDPPWRATTAPQARGHPPELRHAARARRRQRRARHRLPARAGRRLAPPRGGLLLSSSGSSRAPPALQRPDLLAGRRRAPST
jgi:hypothetical protein